MRGFTLIELLISISIIGILIGLSIFGLAGAREGSRDARRKSDLELIRSGLEIYRADCSKYPNTLSSPLVGDDSSTSCSSTNTYISQVPSDPIDTNSYSFKSLSNFSYVICAHLEKTPQTLPDTSNCGSCGETCNYVVGNP